MEQATAGRYDKISTNLKCEGPQEDNNSLPGNKADLCQMVAPVSCQMCAAVVAPVSCQMCASLVAPVSCQTMVMQLCACQHPNVKLWNRPLGKTGDAPKSPDIHPDVRRAMVGLPTMTTFLRGRPVMLRRVRVSAQMAGTPCRSSNNRQPSSEGDRSCSEEPGCPLRWPVCYSRTCNHKRPSSGEAW